MIPGPWPNDGVKTLVGNLSSRVSHGGIHKAVPFPHLRVIVVAYTKRLKMVEQNQLASLPAAPSVWIILGPVLLLGVLAVLLSVFARTKPPPDDGWKGIFYSNHDDPALFNPKQFGIGYTL